MLRPSKYAPSPMSKVSSSEFGAMREELPGTCFLRCNWQSQLNQLRCRFHRAAAECFPASHRCEFVYLNSGSGYLLEIRSQTPLSERSLDVTWTFLAFAVWVQTKPLDLTAFGVLSRHQNFRRVSLVHESQSRSNLSDHGR